MSEEREYELLKRLVTALCAEREVEVPRVENDELWQLFRALVNTRPPTPVNAVWLAEQDELLQGMIAKNGIVRVDDLLPCSVDPRLRLWRGDITCLDVDAIVNAANSQMLGCWVPGHHCIDNAIHTFAGVQLRLACARLMDEQGHEEPTGLAKVTPAYNLPSDFVIHTVGPIAQGRPTARHRLQLAQCYRSCLDAAAARNLRSIGFCCISTGIFGFPQEEAAHIAVRSVREWLDEHVTRSLTVVFNVFTAQDEKIYQNLLTI